VKTHLFLGTANPAKVSIVRAALAPLPVDILMPADLGLRVDVQEGGQSTAENAERKARACFAQARLPALAVDGGLRIPSPSEGDRRSVQLAERQGLGVTVTDR
jgi:XTP/dITP diphosphohydrolase